MTNRRYLRPSEKQELWEQQGCQCASCFQPLTLGEVEWDHVRPLALGGTNEENWQGLCRDCHKAKTAQDVGRIRKADRQRNKMETGRGRKRKGKPMQSRGFPKGLRKKLNGDVVKRDD